MAQKFGELLKAAENKRIADEAERQRQIREKKLEQDRIAAAATNVQVRQQTAPAEPFDLIGTIWTRFDLGESIEGKSGFIHSTPMDWEFKERGVLFDYSWPKNKNSWVQNGNSVTVKYNKNFATYELKIINPKLMQGTLKNIEGYKGPVELRRK